MRIRAVVAASLLAGFYLVGLALIGSLLWLAVQLWGPLGGGIAGDVSVLAAAVAIGLAVPTWQLLRARPEAPDGVSLGEEQAPALWHLVQEVADAVGTRVPDEIRLVTEVNAAVWEDAGRVGLRRGQRILYVGVPLLQALTVTQMRAVVAHELGHYARGHAAFGTVAYRGSRSIVRTIDGVGPERAAGLLLTAYAALYFAVALAVLRRLELEADLAAVRVAGARATREALKALPRLAVAWSAAVDRCIDVAWQRGRTTAEMLDVYRSLVAQRSLAGSREVGSAAGATLTSRWNTHPPLTERLSLIGGEESDHEPAGQSDPRAAVDLVVDRDAVAATLDTEAFVTTLEVVVRFAAERGADELYAAAADVTGTKRRGLGGVLDILETGGGEALRIALSGNAGSVDAAGTDNPLTDHVEAAISAAFVASKQARWTYVWGQRLALRSGDDAPLALRPLVARACADPRWVRSLRAHLRECGLDEATAATWALPGRAALDPGTLVGTDPQASPPEPPELLLPDELLLLTQRWGGRSRPNTDVLDAALAAAALAELRIRQRIELADGRLGIVRVRDPTPTGDRFLDSVLARIDAGPAFPAYEWLQTIGPDVATAAYERGRSFGRHWAYNENGRYTLQYPEREAALHTTRSRLVEALRTGEYEGSPAVLGMLLWATEMLKPVLGRTALIPRFWLGRLAARDPLMIAIRTVIGLYMPLPSDGSGGS
jgi:Zn-dependent protease with chaperone function